MINPTKHHADSFVDKAVTLLLDNKENQLVFFFPPTTQIHIYRPQTLSLCGV